MLIFLLLLATFKLIFNQVYQNGNHFDYISLYILVFVISISSAFSNYIFEKLFRGYFIKINKREVRVLRNQTEKIVPRSQIMVGDIVIVASGDITAVDGIVLKTSVLNIENPLGIFQQFSNLNFVSNQLTKEFPILIHGTKIIKGYALLLVLNVECYDTYEMFPQIADDCLAHFNHKIFYNEELEQAIVVEDKPEVTAVVEIEEATDIAFEIVRYNHHALKGDITAKRAILLKMGSQLEPLRSQISACNKTLEKDIFFMRNNLNIRHNNCVPGDAKYKPFVASMDAETLENWYDELYQMILLAKLELANVKRMEQVERLLIVFFK